MLKCLTWLLSSRRDSEETLTYDKEMLTIGRYDYSHLITHLATEIKR